MRKIIDNLEIEVDSNDELDPQAEGYRLHWIPVAPGTVEKSRVVASESPIFVWVRSAGSDLSPEPLRFVKEELAAGGDGIEALVVIEGDLCP